MRVQTGAPVNYPLLRWRGIALTNFDGRRWSSPEAKLKTKQPNQAAGSRWRRRSQLERRPAVQVEFVILLQPLASDTLFAPARVMVLRGNFSGEAGTYYGAGAAQLCKRGLHRIDLQSIPQFFASSL